MLYHNRTRIYRGIAWAAMMAAALVLQATVCNRLPVMGVFPLLLPVATACIAMMLPSDIGALVGLIGGLMASLGGDALYVVIPLLALAGAISGGLCTQLLTRSLPAALLLSLLALCCCELPTWLLHLYTGHAPLYTLWTVVLPEIGYSLLFTPLFFWLSWRISLIARR